MPPALAPLTPVHWARIFPSSGERDLGNSEVSPSTHHTKGHGLAPWGDKEEIHPLSFSLSEADGSADQSDCHAFISPASLCVAGGWFAKTPVLE